MGFAALLGLLASARASDLVTIVDVLVVGTPSAVSQAGDYGFFEDAVRVAMVSANLVLQNSEARLRVRLAGVREVDYVESGSLSNDLFLLRTSGDAQLGLVPQLRDNAAADLVCLVTATGDVPYVGAPGPSAANAFSVVRFDSLSWKLIVALSRNFGCLPERGAASLQPSLPFAYGQMVNAADGTHGSVESSSDNPLSAFSNPDAFYKEAPMGVPAGEVGAADNARALNLITPIVAGFRGGAPRTLPPVVQLLSPTNGAVLAAGSLVTLAAQASDPDGRVVSVEFFVSGFSVGMVTNAPFEMNWLVPAEGDYWIRAVATDDLGASTVSEMEFFFSRPVGDLGGCTVTVPGGWWSGDLLGSCESSVCGSFTDDWLYWLSPSCFSVYLDRPPNDDFTNRVVLSGTTNFVHGWTSSATAEPGEPAHAGQPAQASVWYEWTAPFNGHIRIWAGSCNIWPRLAAYTGDMLTNLTAVASSGVWWSYLADYAFACQINFQVSAGITYKLAVDADGDPNGEFDLGFLFVPAPPNDDFAQRTLLLEPSCQTRFITVDGQLEPELFGTTNVVTGSNYGASKEPGEPNHAGNLGGASVWWSWAAPRNGRLNLDPSGTTFSNLLGAYTGDSLPSLTAVASNIGGLEFPVREQTSYALALDGADGARGDFTLALRFFPCPLNDDFANAKPRTNSTWTIQGNTHAATVESNEPLHGDPQNNGSVWWRWTAPASGDVQVTGSDPRGALSLGAYAGGSLGRLLVLSNGVQQFQFCALHGVSYWIAAAGPSELDNPFTGSLVGPPAPAALQTFQAEGGGSQWQVMGLAGQSFVLQTNRPGVGWENVLIDTLQDPAQPLVLPAGDYRLISLEDFLLNAPLKLLSVRAQAEQAAAVEITGRPGQPFVLQGSEDLQHWSDLHFGTVTGVSVILRDDASLPLRCRFYRIQALE